MELTPALRRFAAAVVSRPSLLVALAASAAGCGDDPGPIDPDLGLPLVGVFAGTLPAAGNSVVRFTPGRAGATYVSVCGPAETDFNVSVGGTTSATSSNCEEVVFTAAAGVSYDVTVTAADGSGPFSGCFSVAIAPCDVIVPAGFSGDTTAPAGYYDAASGLTGTALIAALNDLIDNQEIFDYTRARDSLYAVVDDPDDDDVITDIYVGRSAIVRDRSSATANDFNAEHLWPQSRGADSETVPGFDLFILATVDEGANGQRLNYPFGRVTGSVLWESETLPSGERSRLGYNGSGVIVFEPRASRRGDIARAIMYFYVRYRGEGYPGFSLANFNIEEPVLIQWHSEDPPDAFERARHARVYRVQGNRNPFIDRPEYVAAIGDFPNN